MYALKAEFEVDCRNYEASITQPEDRANFARVRPLLDSFYKAWDNARPLSRAQKNDEAYRQFVSEGGPIFKTLQTQLQLMQKWNSAYGSRASDTALGAASSASTWAWMLLVAVLAAGGLISFFMSRGIERALTRLIRELSAGADQVASAAAQVASSSQALAQGSSEQAASLEETSASSEEINSMAQRNSENSLAAAGLVAQSQQKFEETNETLDQMVIAMEEINTQSNKISKIIKVIDEIAFQTNILALNAAVEAARAGESGMGFAVVADEVRSLAQRSAQAAKDTAALIEESILKSNKGKTRVDQVNAAIRAITGQSAQVKTLVDEVQLGSQEQARGINEVGKAIVQMERVTQSSAASAEEGAAAAEELTAQASTLQEIVDSLTAMVGGSGATGSAVRYTSGAASSKHSNANKAGRGASPAGSSAADSSTARATALAEAPAAANRSTGAKNGFPLDEDFSKF